MRVRYVCFPGLGQNRDIAWPQQTLPFEVIGVDYIAPSRGETLSEYARRFAAGLCADGVLVAPERTVLAGVSFGSAVAQEVAAVWPCAGQVMLSGLRSCREIPALLRLAGRIAPYVPDAFDPLVDVGAAFVIRRFANITHEESLRCAAMVRQFPLPWLREHARMVVSWPGCACDVPTLRIHGDRDHVVLARRARDVDLMLAGDRHLSSVARAAEVNAAIVEFAQRVVGVA